MGSNPESRQVGISNTEVQQAYNCEMAWFYGFHPERNFQVASMGVPRTIGIQGHKALEIFFLHLREGADYDFAAQQGLNHIQSCRMNELKAGDFCDADLLAGFNLIYERCEAYFEHYRSDVEDYEILEVEPFHAMEWENEEDFYLPMRLDTTVLHKRGEFKGEVSPMDHKFIGKFYTYVQLRMNSQFPLQQRALRAARFARIGQPIVKRTIVNMISTHKTARKENWFKRETFPYEDARIERIFGNHMKSAVRLAWLKRMPAAEAQEEVRAALGSASCKFCDFKDVCDVEFEGGDPYYTIQATLKPNEYGYPPLEEIRGERA